MQKPGFSKLQVVLDILGVILLVAVFLVIKNASVKIPASLLLQVPFSPQAPTDNWSRNEDCEETSITMANAFLTGNTQNELPAAVAQAAINKLKKWEGVNLGYNANTGADATTQMAQGALGLKVTQIQNYTQEDLKKALVKNHPVLLPINAKLLGSPQYFNNGPTYHVIVVRGFRGDVFIVNDPGTNNGNGNEYTFEVLKNAAADWNQTIKKMDPTRKIALIVGK